MPLEVAPKRRPRSTDASRAEARAELIACAKAVAALATHRKIRPMRVHFVEHDREIRSVLERVVRRWSQLVEVKYTTPAAARAMRSETHIEHVVPIRLLVDRMIMQPRQIRRLLEDGVVLARVTKREHQLLGGLYSHTPRLYGAMLRGPVERLPAQGRHRYKRAGIRLERV